MAVTSFRHPANLVTAEGGLTVTDICALLEVEGEEQSKT